MCSTGHVRNGILFIGRGLAYHKTEETDLLWSKGGHVDREGCGVPQNRRNGPPTVETGVLFIGRGVAYRKTGLHGILFISTVDLLQPPRAPVHPASTARYSTGYCSTTPPPSTVHPALHHLLFIQPSTGWSCSSCPPRGPVHPAPTGSIDRGPVHPAVTTSTTTGSCSSNPHWELFIQSPPGTVH